MKTLIRAISLTKPFWILSFLLLAGQIQAADRPTENGIDLSDLGVKIPDNKALNTLIQNKIRENGIEQNGSKTCAAGRQCQADCLEGNCVMTCAAGANCDFSCSGGGCTMNCAAGAKCNFGCAGGNCSYSCAAGSNCDTSCLGGGCKQ